MASTTRTADQTTRLPGLPDDLLTDYVTSAFSPGTDQTAFLTDTRSALSDVLDDVGATVSAAVEESPSGVVTFSNPLFDDAPGPTPTTYRDVRTVAHPAEAWYLALGAALGTPIGYVTQQAGRLVNDIVPLRSFENVKNASSSTQSFDLHNEDAFLTTPPRYFLLQGMRNDEAVGTRLASVPERRLSDFDLLHQPVFQIGTNARQGGLATLSPASSPVAWSEDGREFFRVNELTTTTNDALAAIELTEFLGALRAGTWETVVRPGEIIVVDNWRVAHARDAYRARYDGTDRWLQRLVVSDRRGAEQLRPFLVDDHVVGSGAATGSGSRA